MNVFFGDLEANGFLDVADRVHCGVFINKDTKQVHQFRPHQIKEMLTFMDSIDVLVMHHGIGYDWPLLEKLYGYTYKGKRVDTLIMSRLLNPKRVTPFNCPNRAVPPNSIEAWGYRVGRGKPEHNDWENFSEDMLHRCTEDVEILALVYDALLEESKGEKWRNAFLMSFDLFSWLQKQEAHGWLVDSPHMEFCISQLTGWIRRIDSVIVPKLPMILEINEIKKDGEYVYVKKPFLKSGGYAENTSRWILDSGYDIGSRPVSGPYCRISFRVTNLDSGLETKSYLLNQGWEPLEWNTNDAGERTSPKLSKDDPFDGVEGKIGKLVAKRVQCRHRRSSVEGLIGLVRPDGRIASAVNTLAATGRATHRNIVNIPRAGSFFGRQMRQIFVCPEDRILVGTDSDANQIRMLAGRMNDPTYTDAVVNGDKDKGTDIHSVNMRAAELKSRDDAKTFFYGILFGAGDAKTGKIIKGAAAEGKRLKAKFFEGLPALGVLIEKLTTEWRNTARQKFNAKFNRMESFDGTITGLDGRPIKVPSEHMVLVYMLQSDEAIMMSKAYIRFHERMTELGYTFGKEYNTVCFYHDEYTVECDEGISEIVAKESEDAIAWAGEYYKIACPHLGHAKKGKSWFSIH